MARVPRVLAVVCASALSFVGAGCGFQRSTNVVNPVAPTQTPPAGSPSSVTPQLVGTWVSAQITGAPNLTNPSCTDFQFQIASQTSTSIAGTFTATCGSVPIEGRGQGQLNGTAISLSVTGSGSLPGIPNCQFSLTGNGTIQDSGNTLNIPYSGTTCLGPVTGTEVLHRPQRATAPPAPAPNPAPPPPPPPAPTPSGPQDGLNLGAATIENSPPDVPSWPVTAALTLLDLAPSGAHVEFTKKDGPGSWPDVPFGAPGDSLEYTLWIVINVNGHWYASGCIEYWRGLDRNGGPPAQYAQNWYYDPVRWGPMAGHQPAPGEQVGFLVTAGDARNNGNTLVKERSNVVVIPFPADGGGTYTFSRLRTR